MKKLLCFLFLFVLLSGCSQTGNNLETDSEKYMYGESTIIDDSIYNGSLINIKGIEITDNDLIFINVENKTDKEINVSFNVSIDGYTLGLWNDISESTVQKKEEKQIALHGDFDGIEHKYLSLSGIVFVNNSGEEIIDITDFPIGEKENRPIDVKEGYKLYENDNIYVEYMGADSRGINLGILNKRNKSIDVFLDKLYVNEKDIVPTCTTVPGNSWSNFSLDVESYDESYLPDNVEKINAKIVTQLTKGGAGDKFIIEYNK